MPVIYKITSPTNKVYISQTVNFVKRRSRYKRSCNPEQVFIYNSIQKHGWDKHVMEVICELPKDVSQSVLDTYEILYWQMYIDCGYTMLNAKTPGSQAAPSRESIEKTAEKNRGRKHSEETRRKRSEALKGREVSEETRKKIGDAQRGRKMPEERRLKHVGVKVTEEAKRKISEKLTGVTWEMRYGKDKAEEMRLKAVARGKETKAKSVLCIETGMVFRGVKEVSEYYKVSRASITLLMLGKTKNSRLGLTFKYI